ncbi:MAG: hypothetical protein RPT11_00710 [Bermanella sp.]
MTVVRSQYRIKQALSDWLSERARKNNRTKNGELISILEAEKAKEENTKKG